MKAGDLDRRITLKRLGAAFDDGFTKKPAGMVVVAERIAAQHLPVSDGERVRAQQAGAAITDRFRIRYAAAWRDVAATWQLDFDGRAYDVTGVKPIGRRVGFELTCKALADTAP